jgi:hypothetical protein
VSDGAAAGPGAPLTWERGGDGALVHLDGERARVRSSIASAPGSRLEGTLESGPRLRIKVHRCRRLDEPGVVYELEGRLIDLTREARAAMVALLGGA